MKSNSKILFFLILAMLTSCSARKVERERKEVKVDSTAVTSRRVETAIDRTVKEVSIKVEVADTTKPIVFDDGVNPPVVIHNVKKVVLENNKVQEKIVEKTEEKAVVEVKKEEKAEVKKTDKKAFPFLKVGFALAFIALLAQIILITRKKLVS